MINYIIIDSRIRGNGMYVSKISTGSEVFQKTREKRKHDISSVKSRELRETVRVCFCIIFIIPTYYSFSAYKSHVASHQSISQSNERACVSTAMEAQLITPQTAVVYWTCMCAWKAAISMLEAAEVHVCDWLVEHRYVGHLPSLVAMAIEPYRKQNVWEGLRKERADTHTCRYLIYTHKQCVANLHREVFMVDVKCIYVHVWWPQWLK